MKKRIKRTAKKTKRKNAFKKLEQKVKRDLGNQVEGVVYNAPGEIKMSDALEEVITPFMDEVETLDAMKKLVGLGTMAWNIALMTPDEQNKNIQTLVERLSHEPEHAEILSTTIHKMIQRKQILYPDVKRVIMSFEIEDTRDGWYISVASTLSPQD